MNIMKTEMLLLDNKIKNEQAGRSATVMAPVPAPVELPQEEGMNALMFKGLQNLMANPDLAGEARVGNEDSTDKEAAKEYVAPFSSNLAFKSGKSKILTAAIGALALSSLTSCLKFPESKPDVNIVIVKQDQAALAAAIASLEAQIADLKQQMADRDKAQAERDQKMLDVLTQSLAQLTDMNLKLANVVTKEDYNKAIEEMKALLTSQNSAIIDAIVILRNTTKEEAQKMVTAILAKIDGVTFTFAQAMAEIQKLLSEQNSILQGLRDDYKNDRISTAEWRNKLLEALGDIYKVIGEFMQEFVSRDDQNKEMQKELLTEAQKNNANWAVLQPKVTAIINGQRKEVELILLLHKDLKNINTSVVKTKEDLANAIGVSTTVIDSALKALGLSIEQIANMDTQAIINAFNNAINGQNEVIIQAGENVGQRLDGMAVTLQDIYDKLLSGEITESEAIELLRGIKQGVDDINKKLDEYIGLFKSAIKGLYAKIDYLAIKATQIEINGRINNAIVSDIDREMHAMRVDVHNSYTSLQEIRDAILNGEIKFDDSRIVAELQQLGITINGSKDDIIREIDKVISHQVALEKAINRLDKNNQSKLNYIACLIKNKTNDNSDIIEAIQALAEANAANLDKAVEALAGKLDILIGLVNDEIRKIDGISGSLNTWGQQIVTKLGPCGDIVRAIKENGKKLDRANMTQYEMLTILRNVKPQIETLAQNSTLANGYLEFIANKQPEILTAINNIQNIGGGGITAEEMDSLMFKYSDKLWNDLKAYLDGIHAENMSVAGDVVTYQMEGNQTALDIYNLLLNKLGKLDQLSPEELMKLIKAIYDYLPELKCQCTCKADCDDNSATEEVIGDLK